MRAAFEDQSGRVFDGGPGRIDRSYRGELTDPIPQPLVRSPTQPFQVGSEADPGERQGEAQHSVACEAEA